MFYFIFTKSIMTRFFFSYSFFYCKLIFSNYDQKFQSNYINFSFLPHYNTPLSNNGYLFIFPPPLCLLLNMVY